MYDEAVRVPFLLSWPSRISPKSPPVEFVTSSIDVWPTISGLLGLPQPVPTDGRSMHPLIAIWSQAPRGTVEHRQQSSDDHAPLVSHEAWRAPNVRLGASLLPAFEAASGTLPLPRLMRACNERQLAKEPSEATLVCGQVIMCSFSKCARAMRAMRSRHADGAFAPYAQSPKRALADERMSPARRAARLNHNFSCVPPVAEGRLAQLFSGNRSALAHLNSVLGICRLWSRHDDPMQLRDISRNQPAKLGGLLRVLRQLLEAQRFAAASSGYGAIEYEEWLSLIFSLNAAPPPPLLPSSLSAAPQLPLSPPVVAHNQNRPSSPRALPPSAQFDTLLSSPRSPPPLPLPLGWVCNDQCSTDISEAGSSPFSADGACDDGGTSSKYDVCEAGSDCRCIRTCTRPCHMHVTPRHTHAHAAIVDHEICGLQLRISCHLRHRRCRRCRRRRRRRHSHPQSRAGYAPTTANLASLQGSQLTWSVTAESNQEGPHLWLRQRGSHTLDLRHMAAR